MAYGFYLKKNRRKFRKVSVQSKTPVVAKYQYPKKYVRRPKAATFAKRVNQIISRNVENKRTLSYASQDYVCTTTNTGVLNWYLLNNWNVKLFTISQGTTVQSRIGNQIKLKRWVIRGQIAPAFNTLLDPTNYTLPSSLCGTVDVYFGRLLNNNEITNTLTALYENGSSSADPAGTQAQIFRTVNKDEYKIYYKKSFKMSPANQTTLAATSTTSLVNNDFSLTRTFGFDVCKSILKNAVIKYNDTDNDPNNAMIRQLALFATFTPAIGDLEKGATYTNYKSFYKINLQAYAEYEDA